MNKWANKSMNRWIIIVLIITGIWTPSVSCGKPNATNHPKWLVRNGWWQTMKTWTFNWVYHIHDLKLYPMVKPYPEFCGWTLHMFCHCIPMQLPSHPFPLAIFWSPCWQNPEYLSKLSLNRKQEQSPVVVVCINLQFLSLLYLRVSPSF